MRHAVRALILAGILAAAVGAQEAPPRVPDDPIAGQPAPERKPTSSTTAILRVACEPASGLASAELIASLLQSSGFMKMATPPLENQPTSADWSLRLEPVEVGPGVCMTRATVHSYDQQLPADKILESVGNQLQGVLTRLSGTEERLAEFHRLKAQRGERVARTREQLLSIGKSYGISALREEAAYEDHARRQAEFQSLTVELAGLEARSEELQKQIALAGAQTAENLQGNPVIEQLANVVELRRKRFQILTAEVQQARSKPSEAAMAQIELAEAQAELEKYRRAAAQAAGGERLAELQRRLGDTSIEIAEDRHKQAQLQRLVQASLASSAAQAQMITELESDEQEYREVAAELSHLRIKQETQQPTVTVIPIH